MNKIAQCPSSLSMNDSDFIHVYCTAHIDTFPFSFSLKVKKNLSIIDSYSKIFFYLFDDQKSRNKNQNSNKFHGHTCKKVANSEQNCHVEVERAQ
jgi:hypothetical protein